MPDLLLELFSEEIPARMQAKAAEDLRKAVTDRLVEAGLVYEGAKAFVTPRRLALAVHGVPARQPDIKDERKGPKVGAPEQAIAGFLRAAGLKSIGEAKVQADKKGDFYVAVIEKPGRAAIDVIGEIIPGVIKNFPWPKSMRWGAPSKEPGALTWVRPLHSIVATFGPETEDPDIVQFSIDGIAAGNETRGHRFMAPQSFSVRRLDDYQQKLDKAKVVLDAARRREIILTEAKNLAFAQGLELVEDEGLLNEVCGLVEWPVVLMGAFDASFLSIPEEVIRATIRNNQKCFVLRDAQTAKLTNKFLLVSNLEAEDGGKEIIAGNERVIRARLSDAKFFYETDLKTRLEDRLPKFEHIVFHEKLGTQAERIKRIEQLAGALAPLVGADQAKAKRAAKLCKADLLTEVVGEFPELQGLMGKYYAKAQSEDESVARASEDHWKPKGPDDQVPVDPISIAVALADKIDTLVGFWLIDEKPTGSKDPYALRRAALGLIRIVLQNNCRLKLADIWPVATLAFLIWGFHPPRDVNHGGYHDLLGERPDGSGVRGGEWPELPYKLYLNYDGLIDREGEMIGEAELGIIDDDDAKRGYEAEKKLRDRLHHMEMIVGVLDFDEGELDREGLLSFFESRNYEAGLWRGAADAISDGLLNFFADRLKVQLREQGARHDLVDAVFAQERQDDLLLITRRVEALGKFLNTEDGKNLLVGYRRAANILRDEEKKHSITYSGEVNPELLIDPIERHLWNTTQSTIADAREHIAREDFEGAMECLSTLRTAVDAFFDKVTVNADDKAVRENRLKLLNEIRAATRAVADFSKIEG